MIISYISKDSKIYIYIHTYICFFKSHTISQTIPFWCPILVRDVSKFQPAKRHLTRFMKPGKSPGARGSEARFGVFRRVFFVRRCFFPFDGKLFSPHFFFGLFWGRLSCDVRMCRMCNNIICGSKDVGFMVNWSQEPCHLWWMPSWCGDSFGLLEYSPGQGARFRQETNRFHRFHSCFRVHRRTFSSQKRVELHGGFPHRKSFKANLCRSISP